MIFFYQSLDIMVCVVLLMNDLNQIESNSINLFQLKVGVPQWTVLCLLPFLTILMPGLKIFKAHHFADDTKLLHFRKSVDLINMLTLI